MESSYLINYFTDMWSCPCTTIWAWKKTKGSSRKGKRPQEERSQMGGHCWLVIETHSPVSAYKRKCLGSGEELLHSVMCPPNTLGNSCQVFMVEWDGIPSGGSGFYQGLFQTITAVPHSWFKSQVELAYPKVETADYQKWKLHVSRTENLPEV
jgi:hypothetical protein